MKLTVAWFLPISLVLASVLLSSRAVAQDQAKPQKAAQNSAVAWLALVDAGKYAESWRNAAQYFKTSVGEKQWESAMQASRSPLGAVQSRKLKSANYARALPGAPDGQYVVIQYDTSFEHKQSAVETITPMLDKDGTWRVSGYFIK